MVGLGYGHVADKSVQQCLLLLYTGNPLETHEKNQNDENWQILSRLKKRPKTTKINGDIIKACTKSVQQVRVCISILNAHAVQLATCSSSSSGISL